MCLASCNHGFLKKSFQGHRGGIYDVLGLLSQPLVCDWQTGYVVHIFRDTLQFLLAGPVPATPTRLLLMLYFSLFVTALSLRHLSM